MLGVNFLLGFYHTAILVGGCMRLTPNCRNKDLYGHIQLLFFGALVRFNPTYISYTVSFVTIKAPFVGILMMIP